MLQQIASAVSFVCVWIAAPCLISLQANSPDALLAVCTYGAYGSHHLRFLCDRSTSKAMRSNVCDNASYDGASNSYTEMPNHLNDDVCKTVYSWACFACRLHVKDESDEALTLLRAAEMQVAQLTCPAVRANYTCLQSTATWTVYCTWNQKTAKGFNTALTLLECAPAMCPRDSSQVHLTVPCMCVPSQSLAAKKQHVHANAVQSIA